MPENKNFVSWFLLLPFFAGIGVIHYLLDRTQSGYLLLAYAFSFASYFYLAKKKSFTYSQILSLGILARAILFFAEPNLSDDFYRFIWDGRLMQAGFNPYLFTPEQIIQNKIEIEGLSLELYSKLNSQPYFSIYPPISQFVFWLITSVGSDSTVANVASLRFIILLFECGNMLLLSLLLKQASLPKKSIVLYALNPLVILELTGNLHFEGVLLFFILLTIWAVQRAKHYLAGSFIALAIATKIVPIMLLPVFIRKLGTRKSFQFFLLITIVLGVVFIPFLDAQIISGMGASLGLFFHQFEFNAGIFFLLREIGFLIVGYDLVGVLGPVLALGGLVLILMFSFKYVNKNTSLAFAFSVIWMIQLSLATTVHPWYIVPMIALSVLTGFKFPIIWSGLIFLTYTGYSASGFDHPFFVIAIEYFIVLPMAWYEIRKYMSRISNQSV